MFNNNDEKRIQHLLSKVDVVSFDIFETLIQRVTSSDEELFQLVGQILSHEGHNFNKDFSQLRIEAQIEASKHVPHSEPTIDEIYEFIHLPDTCDRNHAKDIELKLHKDVCLADPFMKRMLKIAEYQNKTIIATSDMYLTSNVIRDILNSNGLEGVSRIFVSCEIRKSKRQGDIFQDIITKLGIPASKIMHIGDSKRGDFLQPLLHGLKAFRYISKSAPSSGHWSTRLAELSCPQTKNEPYQWGYQYLGPLMYGFVKWLNTKLIDEDFDRIYFLSREGYFIKKAFEIVNPSFKVPTSYLYVSRKSTIIPTALKLIEGMPINDVTRLVFTNRSLTFSDVLNEIGMSQQEIAAFCSRFRFHAEQLVPSSFPAAVEYEIKTKMLTYARDQRELLMKYLQQENFFSSNVALVDIGWRGSMQKALSRLVKDYGRTEIHGYYLGFSKEAASDCHLHAEGYVFSPSSKEQNEELLTGFRGLMETLFMPPHGSTINYLHDGNQVTPHLDKLEYSKTDTETLTQIQNGALDYLNMIVRSAFVRIDENDSAYSFQHLAESLYNPSPGVFTLFNSIHFYDHGKSSPMAQKVDLRNWLNINSTKKKFLDSPWRIGFIKINMPFIRKPGLVYARMRKYLLH